MGTVNKMSYFFDQLIVQNIILEDKGISKEDL